MKIRTNAEDIIKGKLYNTLSTVEGFLTEAEGDKEAGTSYSAKAVYGRMSKIKQALMDDIKKLSRDIEPEDTDIVPTVSKSQGNNLAVPQTSVPGVNPKQKVNLIVGKLLDDER